MTAPTVARPGPTAAPAAPLDDPVVVEARPDAPAGAAPPRHRLTGRTIAAVGGLTVLALALWLPAIGSRYWIDEALSIGIAERPLTSIPGLLRQDGSPPLWYLLLHGWIAAFGDGEWSTHAFSTVFAAAAVPTAWWSGRRLTGTTVVAAIAAGLVALSPFLAYFAHETRMYTLVVLLALVVLTTFVGAFVDRSDRARIGFVVSSVALLYTHNWGLYALVAAGLATLALTFTSDRFTFRRALPAFVAIGVCYLPWVPTLLGQLGDTGAPWSFTPGPRALVRELAALVRDERVLAVLVVAAGGGLWTLRTRLRTRESAVALVVGCFAALPVAIGWLAAQVEPSWATRYLAVVVGPLAVLLAIGLSRSGPYGAIAIVAGTALILQPITRIEGNLEHPTDAKSNAAGLATEFAGRLDPGDVVVVVQPEAVPLVAWYLGDDLGYADPSGPLAEPELMDWRDAEARLESTTVDDGLAPIVDSLGAGQRLLLVVPGGEDRTTDTEWVTLFRRKGLVWRRVLDTDDRLVRVDSYGPGSPTETPLVGLLYVRR